MSLGVNACVCPSLICEFFQYNLDFTARSTCTHVYNVRLRKHMHVFCNDKQSKILKQITTTTCLLCSSYFLIFGMYTWCKGMFTVLTCERSSKLSSANPWCVCVFVCVCVIMQTRPARTNVTLFFSPPQHRPTVSTIILP